MLNNILKVYGEDLASGALNQAAIAAGDAVAAGSTQGALCVNAFAVGDVATTAAVTITVKHGDTENGSFADLLMMTIDAEKSFADGELMATATLPADVKDFVTAAVASATGNSGSIRVTLGYLAR